MIKKIFAVIVLCCALIAFLLLTPMSNAGGVTKLEGSYFNVMGLPVQRIYEELKVF